MSDGRITTDAIYLLLKEQGDDIKEIKADVKAQNGRVRALEEDAIRIKTVWSVGVVAAALGGDWIKHKLGL